MQAAAAVDVSASRAIAVDPHVLWSIVAEVTQMGSLSPETVEAHWLDERRGVGAQFRGRTRLGPMRWSTVATVTADEPGAVFAFETAAPSSSAWTYRFEAVEGGTIVTESVRKADPQILPIRVMQRLVGVRDRAEHLRSGMLTTLDRLAAVAMDAASSSPTHQA